MLFIPSSVHNYKWQAKNMNVHFFNVYLLVFFLEAKISLYVCLFVSAVVNYAASNLNFKTLTIYILILY